MAVVESVVVVLVYFVVPTVVDVVVIKTDVQIVAGVIRFVVVETELLVAPSAAAIEPVAAAAAHLPVVKLPAVVVFAEAIVDHVSQYALSLQKLAVGFEVVVLAALLVVVNRYSAVPIAVNHELLVVALQVVTAEELTASWLTFVVLPDLAQITEDGVVATATVVPLAAGLLRAAE